MIKFFTFLWEIITGIVSMITKMLTTIPVMVSFITGFGILGAFIATLLIIRVIKWVANR